MFDLVIRETSLLWGTKKEPIIGDLAVEGDRIAAVGSFAGSARVVVDGRGLNLSPGFIDVHSHDDFAAFLSPDLPWKLQQGVTTTIVGNCGIGAAPFPAAQDWFQRLHPSAPAQEAGGYEQYFAKVQGAQPALNVGVLAGHGALRAQAAPLAHRALNSQETAALSELLDEALEAGVLGMSAGLIYEPGVFSSEEELVGLCRRLLHRAPLFTIHLRSEADGLVEAVDEAIRIAETAGVGLQLSHHKAHGRNNWGAVEQSLQRVDAAIERGVDVWLDQYPYTAGSTILEAIIERGGLDAGPTLGRLEPEDIVISHAQSRPEWAGQSLGALAQQWGVDAKVAAQTVLRQDPGAWVVVFAMSPSDVELVMSHPRTLFGSDGLPTEGGRPHPRLWGTFPEILGRFVREQGTLSLVDAIHKMTSAAAQRFDLAQRGELKEGNFADLVLFDAAKVHSLASYSEPRRTPQGIEAVWVNGVLSVKRGKPTGLRAGRTLRRRS